MFAPLENNPEAFKKSLQSLYDLCDRHDWFYDFSDYHPAFMKGSQEWLSINMGAKLSDQHKEMVEAFRKYHFERGPNNTYLHTKPTRPE